MKIMTRLLEQEQRPLSWYLAFLFLAGKAQEPTHHSVLSMQDAYKYIKTAKV